MKIKISYFYNIRFFKSNEIPVSTALWDPAFYHNNTKNQNYYFVDKRGILNGIKEDSLILNLKTFNSLSEQCSKDCPYKYKAPDCDFMKAYLAQLRAIDFEGYLLPELNRIAEDVRKITKYEGEPTIVLMVHEKPDVICSERPCLKQVFKEHNIILEEWDKE